jgi:hypothetical protein
MLPVLTFLIILIAAVISFALQAAVISLFDTEEDYNTISRTSDQPAMEEASDIVKKNEDFSENANQQQILIFPSPTLGELKVERG